VVWCDIAVCGQIAYVVHAQLKLAHDSFPAISSRGPAHSAVGISLGPEFPVKNGDE